MPTPSEIFKVGDGATVSNGRDRYGATIVEISARRVTVQEDTQTRTDDLGMSDAQSYEHSPNPNGRKTTFTLRKNGRWVMPGEGMRSHASCSLGHRSAFYDYSF